MDRKEFAREQKWLDRVYKEIDEQLAEQEAQVKRLTCHLLRPRKGIAVHGRIVVGRHADGRDNIVRQHAAQCFKKVQLLRVRDRLSQLCQEHIDVRDTQGLWVVALKFCGDLVNGFHGMKDEK